MGEIFLARQTGVAGFDRLVILKSLLPDLAEQAGFIDQFLDEARVAATLQHPNIVQMYDIGAAEDNYFISMEYVHGEDVRSIMRQLRKVKRPLPLDQAINICIGICAGLHYAHDKVGFDGKPLDIVHRDINPQNVIVTYDGGVKILDFGIAKASNRLNTETRHGTLKGKIPYMSPEQCQGRPLDRRSDIYAIGIMLYELTTGTRLYRGESDFEVMKQIVEHPVIPPSARKQPYPLELEQIVMRALQKEFEPKPDALPYDYRYQTAQELQADLESFVRQERLVVSNIALSAFMHDLFGDRINAWREASVSADRDKLVEVLADRKYGSNASGSSASHSAIEVLDDEDVEEVMNSELTVRANTPVSSISMMNAPALAQTAEPVAPPPRRRGLYLALGAAGVAAAGAVALWFAFARSSTDGSAPPAAALPAIDAAPVTRLPPPPDAAPAVAATGSARIETEPPGAAVAIDGVAWSETTPTDVPDLAAGPHRLRLELAGHQIHEGELAIASGQRELVQIALPPVEVAIADRPDGPRPRGPKGREPKDREPKPADPRPDQPAPDPPAASGPGTLRIASTPSCELIIDGRARGATPQANIELPAGPHQVQLVNSRYGIDRTYTIVIEPGKMTKKSYTFPVDGP
jgi:serine/threonine protein kinase